MHGSTQPGRLSKSDALARALDRGGALPLLSRRGTWHGLLTLTYHRIGDGSCEPGDRNLFSATADEFDDQLAFLQRNVDVIGPDDVGAALRARRGRHVLITFDDGYRDNLAALDVLRSRGMRATWFISTGLLDEPRVPWWDEVAWMVHRSEERLLVPGRDGRLRTPVALDDLAEATGALLGALTGLRWSQVEPFLDWLGEATGSGRADRSLAEGMWMDWDDVRALRDAGMGIGGHTVDHPILARCDAATQAAEIEGGLARLEEQLGERPRQFAYPVGGRCAFDATTKAAVRDAGIEHAFAFFGGYERAGGLYDPLALRRVYVGRDLTAEKFRARIALPRLFAREGS